MGRLRGAAINDEACLLMSILSRGECILEVHSYCLSTVRGLLIQDVGSKDAASGNNFPYDLIRTEV